MIYHQYHVDIDDGVYSQIPFEDGSTAAPVVETSDGFPILQSSPVSLPVDSNPIIAQPIAEQVSETTYEVK